MPVTKAIRTDIELVSRLSFSADMAVGESIYLKKSSPMALKINARMGRPNNPINNRLGRMNTQPGPCLTKRLLITRFKKDLSRLGDWSESPFFKDGLSLE